MQENTPEMPLMPEQTPARRRIVLEHTVGPHKGLLQIMGTTDALEGNAPDTVSEVFDITPHPRKGQASLIRMFPRYILYREITAPEGLGTFDRKQR